MDITFHVKMLNRETYEQVARIHSSSIDQGFLATLGDDFLTLLYQAIDECEDAVLLVEENQGRVVGFVAGGSGMGTIYKKMLRHVPRLVWALGPVVLQPRKVRKMVEIINYSKDKDVFSGLPKYELFSISVLPESRRLGVAQRLYTRLANYFSGIGAPGFRIVVGEALLPAHAFYQRMGAETKLKIAVHGKQKSFVYVHDLESNNTSK